MPEMLRLTPTLSLPEEEIELTAIRAQGAGGQHVNKVSSAIHLRFDIPASSLPAAVKEKLLARADHRLSDEGVLVIKAQQYRSQDRNRADALQRLAAWVAAALHTQKPRRPTRVSTGVRRRRTDSKVLRGRTKALRRSLDD